MRGLECGDVTSLRMRIVGWQMVYDYKGIHELQLRF